MLVRFEKEDNKVKGTTIIVQDTSLNATYFKGEVLALGSTLQNQSPLLVREGQKVAYLKYGYEDMGEGLHLVEPKALLAILE